MMFEKIVLAFLALASRHEALSETVRSHNAAELAFRMIDSNIARGEGCSVASASTNFIELGIFQQALRESILVTNDLNQRQRWSDCLHQGLQSSAKLLMNTTNDTGYPLDRLSVGTNMIDQVSSRGNQKLLPAIKALQQSVVLQPRNANGGLWYYANPDNLTAYRNLSYLDGMYSFPPFATLSTLRADAAIQPGKETASSLHLQAVWAQLEILDNICRQPSGLLVHGYDAIKAHPWANPVTGASPIVWCRSLAWLTLGLLESLKVLQSYCIQWPDSMGSGTSMIFDKMEELFNSVILAQIQASEHSLRVAGNYGVWQVVDQPGKAQNFVEASSSCMTIYSLLKGVDLGLLDADLVPRARVVAKGIYESVLYHFVIGNENGTLSFNGTSSVASLSGDVSYEYYVTRPLELNSLIGSSAFILASLQIGS